MRLSPPPPVAALAASLALAPALAEAQVSNQVPIPNLDTTGAGQLLIINTPVTGGNLYTTIVKAPGQPSGGNGLPPIGVSSSFVASSTGGLLRYQALTDARSDAGVALTATATSGAMGVARTAGTSLNLVGEATSSSAKTDKAMWELNTATSYVAGAVLPVTVNANYTTTGTVTAASTTITLNAYTEVNGVETAISGVTAAQQFTATATNYIFH